MDIKDVIKGKRVKVIQDDDNLIPIGATGTLMESHDDAPFVEFDEPYEYCFDDEEEGFNNIRAMWHYELEEI